MAHTLHAGVYAEHVPPPVVRRSTSGLLVFLAGAAAMKLAHWAYPLLAGPSVSFMAGQLQCVERFDPTDGMVAFCGRN